ncbi:WD40 repeat domain-containing protein [Catellatospora tritici]|uniref:WD40 repeat domain-containing protein n=1 Tax=Catellatospora tritici TaxID=2851566 RepID=UPI001C2D7CC7|nr:PQQ-binding-like beta-propeller repeat protein [Catellatospora tritici]MBV1854676.1 PQQ-binding-like beta-propeller repeat protein [Catellatospora tritici]
MIYPFNLWGQPLRQIECAELDGATLVFAAGGPPGAEVRVYDVRDGDVRAEYGIGSWTHFQQRPHRVVRGAGGPVLAIGIDNHGEPEPGLGGHFVRLLDPLTGVPAGPSLPSPDVVIGLARFTEHGRDILVVADADGGFSQFDPQTGQAVRPRVGGGHRTESAAVATVADGRTLAVAGTFDGSLTVWDLAAGRPLWTDDTSEEFAFAVAFGSVGPAAFLAVARSSKHVELRDALTGVPVAEPFPLDPDYPPRLGFGEIGGAAVLYVGSGERFDCVDPATGRRLRPTREWPDEIAVMQAAVVDGRPVLFVVDDYVMCELDAETGEVLVGWTDR